MLAQSEKLFFLVQDRLMHLWLEKINRSAESLYDSYREGRPRSETYEEIVERILAPVRAGRRVGAAFYGHPGVFAAPAHEAVARARAEGHFAEMLPGISGDACLFADLGIDPGAGGCQSFEATDFLLRRRRFDPSSHLLLWQVGAIAVADFRVADLWNRAGVAVLAAHLAESYGGRHEVVIYERDPYPIFDSKNHRCRLDELAEAPVTLASILYVPPLPDRPSDPEMRAALGMPPETRG